MRRSRSEPPRARALRRVRARRAGAARVAAVALRVALGASALAVALHVGAARAAEPVAAGPGPTLTFDDAVALAQSRREEVAAAEAESRAVELVVDRAWAALLPQLSVRMERVQFGAREVRNGIPFASIPAFNQVYSADWTLFRGDVLFGELDAVKLEAAAAERRVRATRRGAGFEAARVYLGTLAAESLRDAAVRNVELRRAYLDAARARLAAGQGLDLDVTRATLALAQSEGALARAEAAVRAQRDALAYVTGAPSSPRPLEADLAAADARRDEPAAGHGSARGASASGPPDPRTAALSRPALAPEPAPPATPTAAGNDPAAPRAPRPAADLSAALARNDAVAAAGLIVDAHAARARTRWMSYLPELSVQASYSHFDPERTVGPDTWDARLVLTWLFFDGGAALAEWRAAGARADAAAAQRRLVERGIDRALRTAASDVVAAEAGIRAAGTALEAARAQLDFVVARYRAGLAEALERTQAEGELFEAEAGEVSARLQLDLAHLEVFAAAGLTPTGGEPPR